MAADERHDEAGGDRLVSGLAFRPVPARNAYEETVERLAQAIRLGLVRHGEPLPPERELAPRLGVSRVTLREAIRSLQQAGYVESRRGRAGGTFVIHRPRHSPSERSARRIAREMGAPAVEDALAFRSVLEPGAAALTAEAQLEEERIARLRTLADDVERVPAARYRAADSRLHMALAELSGSPSLASAIADVQIRLTDLLAAIPRLDPAFQHANRQHRAIVEAIAAGDAAAARAAMEEHVGATATLIRGFLT
jgi:DNA-binding FadR family transcriptional regulator